MRLYRVTWADPARSSRLSQGDPGHPLHIPISRQGAGRFDAPSHYAALYAAAEPEGAIGETFGNRHTWTPTMFERPKDDLRRVLVTLETDRRLVDLDDLRTLQRLRLRPSDVVRRDQRRTRQIALRLWEEDHRTVGGITWWSYYDPEWQLAMLWSGPLEDPEWFPDVEVTETEALTLDHPAVQRAAATLPRRIEA